LEIAENYLRKNIYFFIGSGPNLGTAKFGTAKIKEMTQDHALTIITEEFHHYDRSVHENDVAFLIAPQSDGYQRSVETAKFVNKLDADLISIVDEGDTKIKAESKYTFEMDVLPEWLSPLVNIIPLHLFIQHLSIAKVSKGIKSPLK